MKHTSSSVRWRHWLPWLVAVLAVYIVIPQIGIFRSSLEQVRQAMPATAALAFVAISVTFVCSAATYYVLAFRRLRFGRTLLVQIAANFINRLLPAGIGGIGASYRYLLKQKHRPAQAASVVAANNAFGVLGNLLLVAILVAVRHQGLMPIRLSQNGELIVTVVFLIAVGLLAMPSIRARLVHDIRAFGVQLAEYRHRPLRLILALGLQMLLTLSMVTAFWLSCQSVGLQVGFVAALVIFTVGFGIGNAAPTPGGLGGIEAGLVAGLVAYHYTSALALAAVLVFRLCSYWLPLIVSAPMFIYASRRNYF